MKKTIMALMATTFLMTAGAASAAINPVNIGESSSAENIYSVILDKVEAGETAGIQSGFAWAYVNGGFVSLSVNELRKHGSNAGAYFSEYVGEQVMLEFVQKTEEQIAAIEEVIYEMVTTTVEIDDVPARQAVLERLSAEKTRLEAALGVATHSDAHQSQLNAATEALRVANEAVRVANAALSTMEGITATQSYLDAIGELTQGQLNINKVALSEDVTIPGDYSGLAQGTYYVQFPADTILPSGVDASGWYAEFNVSIDGTIGGAIPQGPTYDVVDATDLGELSFESANNVDALAALVAATPNGGSFVASRIESTVTGYTLSFAGSVDPVADSVVDAARDAADLDRVTGSEAYVAGSYTPTLGDTFVDSNGNQNVYGNNGWFEAGDTAANYIRVNGWTDGSPQGTLTIAPTFGMELTDAQIEANLVATRTGTFELGDRAIVGLTQIDADAINVAIDRAYDAGYAAGYDDGYKDGYVVGFSDGVASVTR